MRRNSLRFSYLCCLIMLGFCFDVYAQQQTSEQSTQSLLPEINPRDIEIRGRYRASFSGIRRQPILGFDPKPRVYRIDPNRLPFMEKEEQAIVQFPIPALERSQQQPALPQQPKPSAQGYARLGAANYMTGLLEAATRWKPSSATEIDLFAHHYQTQGHLNDPQDAGYDQQQFSLLAGHRLAPGKKLLGGISYEGGNFFIPFSSAVNALQADQRRDRAQASATYSAMKNPVHYQSLSIAYAYTGIGVDPSNRGIDRNEEQQLQATFSLMRPSASPETTYGLQLEAVRNEYNSRNMQALDNTQQYKGRFVYNKRLNDQSSLSLDGGLAFSSDFLNDQRLSPLFMASAESRFKEVFRLKLWIDSDLQLLDFNQLLQQNPFAYHGSQIPNSQRTTLGLDLSIQPVSATELGLNFTYNQWRNFTYFEEVPRASSGLNNDTYREFALQRANKARIPEARVRFRQYAIGQRLMAEAHYIVRQPDIANSVSDPSIIPANIPQTEAWAKLSFQQLEKLHWWVQYDFTGKRYRSTVTEDSNDQRTNQLDDVHLFSLGARYQITKSLDSGLRILNLLNTRNEFWYDFRERGREVMFELRYIF